MPAARLEWQRFINFVIVVLLVSAGSVRLHAADAGVPSNEDLRHVRAIAEPQVSPDGGRVLIRVTDATAEGGRHHLWLVDVGANTARQLTYSPTADKTGEHDGRWLGDSGNIVFLAKRAEHVQLYRLPMSGGEAHAYELKIAPVVDDSDEPDAIPPKKSGEAPVSKDPIPLESRNMNRLPMAARSPSLRRIRRHRAKRNKRRRKPTPFGSTMTSTASACICWTQSRAG